LTKQPTALAASYFGTWALFTDGTVSGWGAVLLGDGNPAGSSSPSSESLSGVTAIATGCDGFTACALAAGVVKCWGANDYGEVGNGQYGSVGVSIPAAVGGPMGTAIRATAVAVGDTHACASYSDGTVWCWGQNELGELGTTTTTFVGDGTEMGSAVPVQVTGLDAKVIGISAGAKHTCALLPNGSAICWGDNAYGELGSETSAQSSAMAVQVAPW